MAELTESGSVFAEPGGDSLSEFAPHTPLRGGPSCSAQDDTGLGGVCFLTFQPSQRQDLLQGHALKREILRLLSWQALGYPAVILKGESRSFAPLTPLRGAPSCSAQDDTGGVCFHPADCRPPVLPLGSGDVGRWFYRWHPADVEHWFYRWSMSLIVSMKTSPSTARLWALTLSMVSCAVWW